MGRPRLDEVVRYTNGRINQGETAKKRDDDIGNPSARIARERALFNAKCFKGGGQGQHSGDAIGQLWLVGKLDMEGLDETKLRDAVREWWHGREMTFKHLGHKTARYERGDRSSNTSTKPSRAERAYHHHERFLRDASDYEYQCLFDLMEPTLEGGVTDWVSRIVQTEVIRHCVLPVALLACDDDYAKLDAARAAWLAMAGGEAAKNMAA